MMGRDVYVEMKEEEYGKGWARLEQIDPVIIPPSRIAEGLFALFDKDDNECTAKKIVVQAAIYTKAEVRDGLDELRNFVRIVLEVTVKKDKNIKLSVLGIG